MRTDDPDVMSDRALGMIFLRAQALRTGRKSPINPVTERDWEMWNAGFKAGSEFSAPPPRTHRRRPGRRPKPRLPKPEVRRCEAITARGSRCQHEAIAQLWRVETDEYHLVCKFHEVHPTKRGWWQW